VVPEELEQFSRDNPLFYTIFKVEAALERRWRQVEVACRGWLASGEPYGGDGVLRCKSLLISSEAASAGVD
jgi:hypothetical protein